LLAIHLDAGGSTSEEKITYVTRMFDVAQKLSIPIVAIPAGGKTGDKELTKQEFATSVSCVNRLKVGASLWLLNITKSFYLQSGNPIQLLNEVKSSALGVNLDPREIYKAGEITRK